MSANYAVICLTTQLLNFEVGDVLELNLVAELTGCWTTEDPEILEVTRGKQTRK
jgi:hypothetical protein